MTAKSGTTHMEIAEKLIQSCRILYREVRTVHNPNPMGHLSARIPGTEEFLIKPRDVPWNKVDFKDLATYDLNYNRLSGSSQEIVELPIHIELYKAREDVKAVVHTHQTYATLMATIGLKLELLDPNTMAYAYGIPTYDEVDDPTYFSEKIGTLIREPRQGKIIANKIGRSNAIILKAHGPVIIGRNVEEVCLLTISLENAAKAQIIASAVKGQGKPIEELGITRRIPSEGLWKSLLESYEDH